jgi:hypothetical protein
MAKARLELDDETEANVIQTTTPDGKTSTRATYKAKAVPDLESDETPNQLEDLDGADYGESDSQSFLEIPKTPLELMFEQLRHAVKVRGESDRFFAYVVRQPDEIGQIFLRPARAQMDLGSFGFSTRDQFNFVRAIQERNGNSGGVFNVKIYNAQQTPLLIERNMYEFDRRGEARYTHIGLVNYGVPDPYIEPKAENGASDPNGMLSTLIAEMRRQHDDFIQVTREMIGREQGPKEKSILEQAVERKLLHEIENPQKLPPQGENSFEKAMAQMILLPQMADRFSRHMFPDPPPVTPETEPDLIDKLDKFGNSRAGQMVLPIVANIVERFSETAQAFAVARMKLNDDSVDDLDETEGQPYPNAAAMNPAQNDPMQELIGIVIGELESERPLDDTNPVIKKLSEDYPAQTEQLIITCQSAPFDVVLNIMINQARKMQPSPFLPFVDVDASQRAGGKFIWNERGEKAKQRLLEFHSFLAALSV